MTSRTCVTASIAAVTMTPIHIASRRFAIKRLATTAATPAAVLSAPTPRYPTVPPPPLESCHRHLPASRCATATVHLPILHV
ncbi:hypothetical protein C8034_v001598 [Colletotrichum sidae]|uniref:Uncharacterized protein n=1 Tax=Colletotrichum sidae TaxID=1347389 RepID=A0A4R8TEH1_9PEZI|nr:hypothetical protein C8034_v001598 [Colletotrichum sidae]